MIVSHEHRFIFIKTRKTASTSTEVLLEPFAGEDAVVTEVNPPVPGHRPRNQGRFLSHASAIGVREELGDEMWHAYFTFCFERNPWDKTISQYFYRRRHANEQRAFREFVRTEPALPSDFDLYSLDGTTIGVDFVGRYEQLATDLDFVLDRIGWDGPAALRREKAGLRPADTSAESLYDAETSEIVRSRFARKITAFGYCPPAMIGSPGTERTPS